VNAKPWSTPIVALALAALLAAGCGGDEDGSGSATRNGTPATSQGPNEITVGVPEQVPPLDPQKRDNLWLRAVTDSIYQALLWRDAEGELQPLLAEALPERVDDTTWRFKIREGITFTNGEPMDARAAAFSVDRMVSKRLNSELLTLIETIEGAEARGRYELDVTTKRPDVLLPSRMPLIKMVPPERAGRPGFAAEPVGTGPYKWVSGEGNGPIVLERVEGDYWGTEIGLSAGSIDTIKVRAIPDVSTRLSALEAGELDLITVLPPDSAESVPKLASTVGIENPMVILNTAAGLTQDPAVREAMNLAVDKDALAEQLFGGYAEVSRCQPTSPTALGYAPDLEPYPYDPERARQLIEDAGAAGERVDLVTSDVFTNGRELAQAIAAYWTDAGLDVEVHVPEFNSYVEDLYAKGAERPAAVYVSSSTDLMDAGAVARQLTTDGIQSAYSNPEVDQLFAEALNTEEPDARARLYQEAVAIACDDAALLNLLNPQDLYGLSERLEWQPRYDSALFFEDMKLAGS